MALSTHKKQISLTLLIGLVLVLLSVPLVRHLMAPKVMVKKPVYGKISQNFPVQAWGVSSAEAYDYTVPENFPKDLGIIKRLDAKPFQLLDANTPVMQFDPMQIKDLLTSLQAQEISARLALRSFESSYKDAVEQVTDVLKKAKTQAERRGQTEKNQLAAQRALESATTEYEQVVEEGILFGTTAAILRTQYESALMRLQQLQELIANDHSLLTASAALVMQVEPGFASLTSAQARQKLLTLVDPEAPLNLYCLIHAPDTSLFEIGQTVRIMEREKPANFLDVKVKSFRHVADALQVDFEPVDGLLNHKQWLDNSVMIVGASSSSFMVPNAAFIDEKTVYVLQEKRKGTHVEHVVQLMDVRPGPGNALYTVVYSGIGENTLLILSWDRPIQNGQVVVLAGTSP